MRILHILNHTRQSNGHVHQAVDLTCQFATDGHAVAVVSATGDFDDLLARHGVESLHIPFGRKAGDVVRSLLALRKLMRAWRPQVVHAHMMQSALLAAPLCRLSGVPLVTTVHNSFDRHAILMRVGTRVITVSEAVRYTMRARGIRDEKLVTVLNGTIGTPRDQIEATLPRLAGAPSVLFVGGLHPRKGVPDLLTAFEAVHRRFPEAKLHIVGAGPHASDYAAQAAASNARDAVFFHGTQSHPLGWMRASDIFVLPSLEEPAGLVLSEAREAGCAVIGTRTGGIPEMLNGGSAGLLVPPNDPVALAEVICGLAADPDQLALWRSNSGIGLEHLALSRVANETMAVYKSAIGSLVRT